MQEKIKKPNVLYVFADQLNMSSLKLFGNKVGCKTPNLNQLAKNGVKFTNSYCSTPQCSPSRSSLLTGLYPHKTEVIGNVGANGGKNLDDDILTIGSYLKEKGYKTGYFGKWHLGTPINKFGFDYIYSHGENIRDSKNKNNEQLENKETKKDKSHNAIKDSKVTKAFIDYVNDFENDPWCAIVSYINPHDIYHVKEAMKTFDLDTDQIKLPKNINDDLLGKPQVQRVFREKDQGLPLKDFDENEWKYYIAYYYYLIGKIDEELGKIIKKLKQTRQYENTIIIFSSDHGDMMGAHKIPFKGPMMYDELIKIPLVISWPQVIPKNETRDQMTVNTDIFPTICELLEYDIPKKLEGESIKDCIFNPNTEVRKNVFIEYYSKQKWVNPIRTVLNKRFKYNQYSDGEELYDMLNDPLELKNLANEKSYNEEKKKMKKKLFEWIKKEGDPFLNYCSTDRMGNLKVDN